MTKATAGQQSNLRSHEFPEKGVDLKLLLNSRSASQSRWTSCRLKVFFTRVTALLAFHALNALLAISGAGLVLAFTVLSIALLPIAFMLLAFLAFVEMTIERFPNQNWVVFTLVFVVISAVILVLLGFEVLFWVVLGTLMLAVYGTLAQRSFVWLNAVTVNGLASLDIELANFIVTRMPLQAYSAISTDKTKMPKIPSDLWVHYTEPDEKFFLDVFTTPAMWSAVFYFLVPKLLVGVLSAVSVWLSVVQPIVVLASSGRFSCIGTGLTFQGNSSVYLIILVVSWFVGVFGFVFVPVWSVRLTAWGCNEPEQFEQQQVQEDLDMTQRSSLEATSVSSFVEFEDPEAVDLLPSRKRQYNGDEASTPGSQYTGPTRWRCPTAASVAER